MVPNYMFFLLILRFTTNTGNEKLEFYSQKEKLFVKKFVTNFLLLGLFSLGSTKDTMLQDFRMMTNVEITK